MEEILLWYENRRFDANNVEFVLGGTRSTPSTRICDACSWDLTLLGNGKQQLGFEPRSQGGSGEMKYQEFVLNIGHMFSQSQLVSPCSEPTQIGSSSQELPVSKRSHRTKLRACKVIRAKQRHSAHQTSDMVWRLSRLTTRDSLSVSTANHHQGGVLPKTELLFGWRMPSNNQWEPTSRWERLIRIRGVP